MLLRFYLFMLGFALACAALAVVLGRRETAIRCLTLAGLVTLLCLALAAGRVAFCVLMAGVAVLGVEELAGVGLDRAALPWARVAVAAGVLGSLLITPSAALAVGLASVSLAVAVAAVSLLGAPRASDVPRPAVPWLLAVHLALGVTALALMLPAELGLLLASIALMQFNDGFAYVVGRRWGRTKLAPRVSPGKTVEGLLGGAAAACVVLALCRSSLFPVLRGYSLVHALGVLAIVVIVGLAGDLLYSLAKRRAGLDDYGLRLPGHGGVLDRLDSLLATAPVLLAWHLVIGDG
jgi:phosphatidate cytidylyltransferase